VDNLLVALESQSLSNASVKQKYSDMIACLDNINNTQDLSTCPTAAAENRFYHDYDPEWSGAADLAELYQPAPNPFSTSMRIAYVIKSSSENVQIGIYDIAGRRVRMLTNGAQGPGRYETSWDGLADDGSRATNGVYFVRTAIAGQQTSSRVILAR